MGLVQLFWWTHLEPSSLANKAEQNSQVFILESPSLSSFRYLNWPEEGWITEESRRGGITMNYLDCRLVSGFSIGESMTIMGLIDWEDELGTYYKFPSFNKIMGSISFQNKHVVKPISSLNLNKQSSPNGNYHPSFFVYHHHKITIRSPEMATSPLDDILKHVG